MSDSEGSSEFDYSAILEHEIKLENEKKEKPQKESVARHGTEQDQKLAKQSQKEQRKLLKLKEKQLKEDIFGDKDKYLKNLAVLSNKTKLEKKLNKRRQPVWNDDDDEGTAVVTRIDNYKCEVTQKDVYKKQLENKFQRLVGTPAWADLNRKQVDADDSDDEILRTIGHISQTKGDHLASGALQFKKLKDLNRETYAEGPIITDVNFHPTSSVGLVTGTRGVATIYSIDGKKNDKLHSMVLKNYPIRRCRLTKDGDEAIFGGSQKYFYKYNLISGQTQRIFLPKVCTKMNNFEMSPCGRYMAIVGRFGAIHILFANTSELLFSLKQEHDATSLAFSNDSKYLFSHCVDSEVNIFDIGERRYIHRFTDDGCINGATVTISPNGQLLAASSQQGVVNVYNYDEVIQEKYPRPQKTILNLTTAISATKFNHTSELLAIASKEVEHSVKIVHFPSATVYHNFPAMDSNIGKPNVVQFSPQSGYLAIGNSEKQVPMFRLKHFNNY